MSLAADDPHVIGEYRLLSRLGTGGMGTVFLGRSPSGREVAVKVIHEQYSSDPDFRTRFRQEIAAARRVSGAFTAAVLDADPDAVRPWMATQYVPGPTLAQRLDSQGPLLEAELRLLALGLVEALRDIHRVGVVHRDLKPANVLMASDGPRVIDFGVSRAVGNRALTVTGHVMGTPPFMSPEQLNSPRTIGPSSDVFSLATLLVYAAVGHGPFDADSPYMTAYHVVHERPMLDGVREPLRGILEYCLVKDPLERPDIDELASLLRRWQPATVAEVSKEAAKEAAKAGAKEGGEDDQAGREGAAGAGGNAGGKGGGSGGGSAGRDTGGEIGGDSGTGGDPGPDPHTGTGGDIDPDTHTVLVRRRSPSASSSPRSPGDRTTPSTRPPLSRRVRLGSAAVLLAALGVGGLVLFLQSPDDRVRDSSKNSSGKSSSGRDSSGKPGAGRVGTGGEKVPLGRRSWQAALPSAAGAFGPFQNVDCTGSGTAVYCGGPNLRTVRLDAATGSTVWQAPQPPTSTGTQEVPDSSPSSPDAKNAVVFVVEVLSDSAKRLAALDTRDGRRLWHRPVGGHRSPAVLGGLVVAPDAGRRAVVARDTVTGATRWTTANPAGLACDPVVLDGQLHGACGRPDDGAAPVSHVKYAPGDGRRTAVRTLGREYERVGLGGGLLVFAKWSRPGGDADAAAAHAHHEGVFSSLLLVDPAGARPPRALALPGAPKGRPVLLGDTVYFVHHWGTVSAYDLRDGARRWTRDTGVRGLGVPGTDRDRTALFLPSLSGRVLALNSRTGSEVWRSGHRGAPPASYHGTMVLRASGTLVVTGTSGEVFSLDPADPALQPGGRGDGPDDGPPPPPPPGAGGEREGEGRRGSGGPPPRP